MRFILLLFLLITISSKNYIGKTTEEEFKQEKDIILEKSFFPRSPMRSIIKPFSNLLNNKVKVPNPIKIRKEINIGKNKKITIGAKNANHNSKLEGSYKKQKI